jgi:hypothetical protein
MSLAMSTFTVNARSIQKQAKKQANKAVGKAKGAFKSVPKPKAKVSSGNSGDWYGPDRPGWLGESPAWAQSGPLTHRSPAVPPRALVGQQVA